MSKGDVWCVGVEEHHRGKRMIWLDDGDRNCGGYHSRTKRQTYHIHKMMGDMAGVQLHLEFCTYPRSSRVRFAKVHLAGFQHRSETDTDHMEDNAHYVAAYGPPFQPFLTTSLRSFDRLVERGLDPSDPASELFEHDPYYQEEEDDDESKDLTFQGWFSVTPEDIEAHQHQLRMWSVSTFWWWWRTHMERAKSILRKRVMARKVCTTHVGKDVTSVIMGYL